MKIIVESERHIGKNPFDFLGKNIIPDGSFVSIGYVTDGEIPNGPRTKCKITPQNDAELTNIINGLDDNLFKESLIKFQNSKAYQDALIGNKRSTAPLDFEGCHIVKISRTIVNWRNPESFARLQAQRGEEIGNVRVKHGFGDYEEEYDEDDWRRAPEYNGTGRLERSRAKGRQGLPFTPMMNTPIYSYPGAIKKDKQEPDALYLRQYRNEGASSPSIWLFVDQNQNYFLLNKDVMNWLAKAFKKPEINQVAREISQEEKDFLKELHSIKYFDLNEEKFILEKILYLTGTTVDDNKNKEPFIWLNDDIIEENFPFLNQNKWIEIMRKCIDNSIMDSYTMNENMKVVFRKSYLRKLNEQKRLRLRKQKKLYEQKRPRRFKRLY